MSRKKVPSDEELSDVTVESTRHKKHRREAETSEGVRYKHRNDSVLSDVKVEGVKRKPRREGDPGEVRTHRPKEGQVRHKRRETGPGDLNVETGKHKQRRNTYSAVDSFTYEESRRGIAKISSRSNDFAYENKAYVGSMHSVNEARNERILQAPTSVYREQYWTCSKWSFAKKVLAIAAGVALGAGIGLAIILVVTGKDAEDVIGGIFMATAPD
ncbi:hypothetical protein PYW08_001332 [Mythimna loreyi]|uniref:Uncharacterized protein n=1 Tax=Mythimna loreyi TaxID=667449 RepID=A0ACC2R0N0_9NEOP|nr:hypothetical protein PYW08_001332 [Mythimna loreyi]